eukprot:351484-Chlamydomonas_euryale.AAC.4
MTPALAIAFVDLAKADASISQGALWGVLKLYGEPRPHVIKLLGGCATRMRNSTYILQCFVDHIFARGPLAAVPDEQFGVQVITKSGGASPTDLMSHVVAPIYANNLGVLADSPDASVGMIGAVPLKSGLFIHAGKTGVMVVG